jgi:predicted RNase H-like nuclease (RuvC/YqgF family)
MNNQNYRFPTGGPGEDTAYISERVYQERTVAKNKLISDMRNQVVELEDKIRKLQKDLDFSSRKVEESERKLEESERKVEKMKQERIENSNAIKLKELIIAKLFLKNPLVESYKALDKLGPLQLVQKIEESMHESIETKNYTHGLNALIKDEPESPSHPVKKAEPEKEATTSTTKPKIKLEKPYLKIIMMIKNLQKKPTLQKHFYQAKTKMKTAVPLALKVQYLSKEQCLRLRD